jgi:hypothetical protein
MTFPKITPCVWGILTRNGEAPVHGVPYAISPLVSPGGMPLGARRLDNEKSTSLAPD